MQPGPSAPAAPNTEGATPPSTSAPQPAESIEDIFGEPSTSDTQEAPQGTKEQDNKPAADSVEDLFGEPGADAAPPNSESFEDLFGATLQESTAPSIAERAHQAPQDGTQEPVLPSESSSPTTIPDHPIPDQIARPSDSEGTTLVAHQPADASIERGLPDLPMRNWTDNTGIYHTMARLVVIGSDSVRLLKDNGRFTTVPLRRLSKADLDYVKLHGTGSSSQQLARLADR
jgi:hypothetical protein